MSKNTVAEALMKAQQFEDNDEFEKAYECYKYAYELDKNDPDSLQKLATCAQALQNDVDAIKYWNLYMEMKPEDPLSYTQLLDLYFHDNKYQYYMTRAKLKTIEGRLDQSTDDYKKAINNTTEEKDQLEARYLLAQTYTILGKNMQAIDEYLRILDHDHNEAVYLQLANLYYTEDKSAALNVLNQAIEKYPDSENIKGFLCKIYLSTGDYEKAEKYAITNFDKIKALLMQEKNEDAKSELDKLSNQEKQNPAYLALMAEYNYNKGNLDETLNYINEFEKTDLNSPLPSQMRALVYESKGNEFLSHFNWGKYYIKRNNHELALNEYLIAYNENKENTDIIKELINLYTSLDDEFAAMEFCEKLVKYEKQDIATLKKLSKFYEKQGFEDKAIEYLYEIVEANPKDYETLLKLAKANESSRKINLAIEYYEKYLKFAPNNEEKEEAKKRYDMLTSGEVSEEEGFLDKILKLFSK